MRQEPEFDSINIVLGTLIITEIFIKNLSIMYKELRISAGL